MKLFYRILSILHSAIRYCLPQIAQSTDVMQFRLVDLIASGEEVSTL